jgi:hypothetical protein
VAVRGVGVGRGGGGNLLVVLLLNWKCTSPYYNACVSVGVTREGKRGFARKLETFTDLCGAPNDEAILCVYYVSYMKVGQIFMIS